MTNDSRDKLMDALRKSLEEGKDFVLDQAPDIVRQIVLWRRAELALLLVVAVLGLVVGVVGLRKFWRLGRSADPRWNFTTCVDPLAQIGVFVCCVVIVTASIGLLFDALATVQVWLAPKTYVLEYLTKLWR